MRRTLAQALFRSAEGRIGRSGVDLANVEHGLHSRVQCSAPPGWRRQAAISLLGSGMTGGVGAIARTG